MSLIVANLLLNRVTEVSCTIRLNNSFDVTSKRILFFAKTNIFPAQPERNFTGTRKIHSKRKLSLAPSDPSSAESWTWNKSAVDLLSRWLRFQTCEIPLLLLRIKQSSAYMQAERFLAFNFILYKQYQCDRCLEFHRVSEYQLSRILISGLRFLLYW